MDLSIVKKYNANKYDTLVIPFLENPQISHEDLGKVGEYIENIIETKDFHSQSKELYNFTILDEGRLKNIVLLDLGNEKEINNYSVFLKFSRVFSKLKEFNSKSVVVLLDNIDEKIKNYNNLEKIFEAAYFVDYDFNKYKNYIVKNSIKTIDFVISTDNGEEILKEAKSCAIGTMLARDIINEPPINMTPVILGEEAKKIGEESGFKVRVYDDLEIENLGMDLFLAVGKGSINKPVLIVMEYLGNPNSDEKIGLIGKGVTFDTGGYSLKSEKSMENMHGDMAGAAAVIGAMKAIAEMELKANIVSVVAACENRVSNNAYLPGDIIKSMSGKYVEINNTDSEGRLTLADAISYIIREHKVDKIIDIATLTDAVQAALGDSTAGVFINNDNMRKAANKAAEISGEKIWELPFDRELWSVLHSDTADFKNSAYGSDAGGGAIVAALFLEEFIEDRPWVHIDIGGTSWAAENLDYCPKGPKGFGTRLLYNMIKELI